MPPDCWSTEPTVRCWQATRRSFGWAWIWQSAPFGLTHRGATWLISLAIAHRVEAELHLALGDPTAALADSQEALRDQGVGRYAVEKFHFTHARVLLANGRQTEAEEYLRRAHERVPLVAEQTDDAELRLSWLEDVRVNREIIADWERLHQTG